MESTGTKQTIPVLATRLSLGLVALLCALAILPIFFVEMPAMLDYPNHLTRMYLLVASGTPNENPYYDVTWKFTTNQAMDIVVPTAARFMSVAAATKAFLVLSQVLLVSGAVAVEMVVKRRHEFAGFVAVMILYCVPFIFGFLPFEFGMGLALWGIASWLVLENQSPYLRLAVHSLFVLCIFVAHLFAFGLYGATIGLHELYRACYRKCDVRQTILTLLVLACPAVLLFGYLTLSDVQTFGVITAWDAANKLRSLIYVFNGYNMYISAIYFIVIFMLMYVLVRSRSLRLTSQGKLIASGFLLLFFALPFQGVFAEVRVVIAMILIIPAFLTISPTRPASRFILPLVVSVIATLNVGQAMIIWAGYQHEYERLKVSFLLIEREAFVLIGLSNEGTYLIDDLIQRPIYHAPVLAAHYVNAFVPSLFIIPGQYALRGRPELRILDNEPVPISILKDILNGRGLAAIPSHVRCWMIDYDYLYLIGPQGPNPLPSRLVTLAAGERFTLYRVMKSSDWGNARINAPNGSRTLRGNTAEACLGEPK